MTKPAICRTLVFLMLSVWFYPAFIQAETPEYVIAVIDTGVDYTHPDLKDHMWINTTDLPGKHGYDFINQDADPMDDFGHGTHCAGVIMQEARKLGVADRVKIMALKYMIEDGSGDTAQAIQAYRYVVDAKKRGVPVAAISNSWGGTDNPKALEDVMREADALGILSICAAGNTAENLDISKTFPSGYDLPLSIVVAAATQKGELASFSCYGKSTVHVAAPGTEIQSNYSRDAYIPGDNLVDVPVQWLLQTTEDDGTETPATNQLHYVLREKPAEGYFAGIAYSVDAPKEVKGICVMEAFQFGTWESIGSFLLEQSNFNIVKWFALDESALALRLRATSVPEGMTVHIVRLGYGKSTGKQAFLSGTSMAAPAVAAEAVYLMSRLPEASTQEIRARIIGGTNPIMPGAVVSDGIIDAGPALENPRPVITDITRQEDRITLRGFFFGAHGALRLGEQDIQVSEWRSDRLTFSSTRCLDEYTPLTLSREDGATIMQFVVLPFDGGNAWQKAAPLPIGLTDVACAGVNGALYVLGGTDENGETNQQVFRFDPGANSWSTCAALATSSNTDQFGYGLSCAAHQGKIYVFTFDPLNESNSLFAFDVQTNTWESIALDKRMEPRAESSIVVHQGSLWLVGGLIKGEKFEENTGKGTPVWRYHIGDAKWEKGTPLLEERYGAIVVTCGDGIVVAGGRQGETGLLQTAEWLTKTGSAPCAPLPVKGLHSANTLSACQGLAITLMTDGHSFPLKGLAYHPQSDAWVRCGARLGYGQRLNMAGAALDGYLYALGGTIDHRITCAVDRICISE